MKKFPSMTSPEPDKETPFKNAFMVLAYSPKNLMKYKKAQLLASLHYMGSTHLTMDIKKKELVLLICKHIGFKIKS